MRESNPSHCRAPLVPGTLRESAFVPVYTSAFVFVCLCVCVCVCVCEAREAAKTRL